MKLVKFRAKQQVKYYDLTNAQEYNRRHLDKVVLDTIEPGAAYAGFVATKTAATEVTLTPGRLYKSAEVNGDPRGIVYSRDDDIVLDLFNRLPLVTKKRVAIVAWGSNVDTDVEPRSFKVSIDPPTYQTDDVSMTEVRYANINDIPGTEAADPPYPTVDSIYTVIAYVLLDTSGVVSVEQVTTTQVSNLRNVNNRLSALEVWRALIGARVDSLATDLAAILARLSDFVTQSDFAALIRRVAALEDRVTTVENKLSTVTEFVGYWFDWFLNGDGTDDAHATYAARVEEGIRFPTAAASTPAALSLLNPSNPDVNVASGFMLPKWSDVKRLFTAGYTSEVNISAYTFATTDIVELTRTRTRLRYGPERTICTNAQEWMSGTKDWAAGTFTFNGETFLVLNADELQQHLANGGIPTRFMIRIAQVWVDTYEEPYWDRVTVESSVAGAMVAQTFLWSQDAYLSALGFYFSRVGSTGDVTVLLTETMLGQPDMTRVLSKTTLLRTAIATTGGSGAGGLPAVVETKHTIPPKYLKGGRRYAVVLVTAGEHYVAASNVDNAVMNGTMFRSTDGGYFLGDLASDMKLDIYAARFLKNRISVEFNEFELSGGARDIDIIAEKSLPPSTTIVWETYLAGVWQPLAFEGADLTSLPAVVRLRATISGTLDLMPGIGLTNSQVTLSRGATAFTWFSDEKTPSTAAEAIKVVALLEDFVEANHDCTATILRGVGETVEAADATEDVVLSNGSTQRTWSFTLDASASTYRVKIVGAAASAAAPYHVAKLQGIDLTIV